MTNAHWTKITCLFVFLLALASPASAQSRKVNIAYTATSPYQAPLIIAREAGFFKKHGLDVSPILTPGGSLGFQAMLGGDVAMVLADGSAAVTGNLAGADIVIIASFLNTFPYSLISLPEIKKVDQLVGGKVAISRFGSATDLSVRMAYNTLIDMARLNIPFELTAVLTTRAFIKSQRDTVGTVIAALAEAIHFYKTEKEPSIKILSKYLQTTDREALDETYKEIALKVVPEKPYPTLPGIQTILDELAQKNPKVKTSRPEDFVDMSFVKKLDDEGFFQRLYKR